MTDSTTPHKPSVLLIGASGLIGSRLVELFEGKYTTEEVGITNGVDITDISTLGPVANSNANTIIHLAAKTDVDGCEDDKAKGEEGASWKINVNGARNVAEICKKTGKKMVYFSTDFVFNGEKKEGEGYTEEDKPDPLSWYAKTKYEGEVAVQNTLENHVILRTAYPYRAEFPEKRDFVRTIKYFLDSGKEVRAVTDHIMCPTFIDDMALAISTLIDQDKVGIYNMSGSTPLSPYDAAQMIAEEFGLDKNLILKTTREEFFKGRAIRPFNIYMKNDKIRGLGVTMNTFSDGLALMHKQL